ncbi:7349_t:CDS:2, partial [Funneliformis geosporum]
MEKNFLPDLSCDIGKLLSSGDNYDVIIQAGEGQYMKEFFAHSLILGARSTYFKAALSKEWAEKTNRIHTFKKPNISPEIFDGHTYPEVKIIISMSKAIVDYEVFQ